MNKKLDQKEAEAILARAAAGERQKDLADEYRVSPATISNLVAGKSWPGLARPKAKPARRGSKLTPEKLPEILRRLSAGEKPGKVAADYGVTRQAVVNIKKGRAWKDIPRPEVPRPVRKRVWEA